jgi:hypothetical protein
MEAQLHDSKGFAMLGSKDVVEMHPREDAVIDAQKRSGSALHELSRSDSTSEKSDYKNVSTSAGEAAGIISKSRTKAIKYTMVSAVLTISGTAALIAGGVSGFLPAMAGPLAMAAGTLAAGSGIGIGMGFVVVRTGDRLEKAKKR